MRSIFILLVLCSLAVSAQTPAKSPATTTGPGAASSNPATLQEVKELMQVLKSREQMEAMLQGFKEQMKRGQAQGFEMALAKNKVSLTAEERQRAQKRLDAIADEMFSQMPFDELLAASAEVYRKHFTSHDIAGLLSFYRSPIGQKFLAEMPALTQESMAAGGDVMSKHLPELMQRLEKRMQELQQEFAKQPAAETKQ